MVLGGSWCYRGPLAGPWWYQPGPPKPCKSTKARLPDAEITKGRCSLHLLENVRVGISKSVRIRKCHNWKLSELKSVTIGNYQNGKVSESEPTNPWLPHFQRVHKFWHFPIWHFPILTLFLSDTFPFWHFPILTLSDSDTLQFWHFSILTAMVNNWAVNFN